jgi:hypothetical protein
MTEEYIKHAVEEALKPLTERLDRLIERTEAFQASINGFTFVQDDDSHWYLIPANLLGEFDQWIAYESEVNAIQDNGGSRPIWEWEGTDFPQMMCEHPSWYTTIVKPIKSEQFTVMYAASDDGSPLTLCCSLSDLNKLAKEEARSC